MQLLSFVAGVDVFGVSVHGLPVKTPLSVVGPALENNTVPNGGVCVPVTSMSVTIAVQVTFELIGAGIGPQLIVVEVARLFTERANVPELAWCNDVPP
jgi:hypothetical protein